MLNVPALAEEKNKLNGTKLIVLLEIEYEPGSIIRFAQWNEPVMWNGNTYQPFPIGPIETSQTVQGEVPAFDIVFSNVGREIQSILEFYDIENRPGKLIHVHPDYLNDPTAKIEEPFVIVSAQANNHTASLTVAPVNFDPLGIQVPGDMVSTDEFPGLLANRSRYLI